MEAVVLKELICKMPFLFIFARLLEQRNGAAAGLNKKLSSRVK